MKNRLMAILLTDLPGYTAYTQGTSRTELEATIRQQQTIIQEVLATYAAGDRARLVKWIGDAALAIFASATDAVLCGRQLQQAILERVDRGARALTPGLKVVVHIGDVNVDSDGDVYGDAVNITARLEKLAEPGEVYFSSTVRDVISAGEIPNERLGEFALKGITDSVTVYRSCFGESPVLRENATLVQTNFVHLNGLAEQHGWQVVHPLVERTQVAILEAARAAGGTNRGVSRTGTLLSFESATQALQAIRNWNTALRDQWSQLPNGPHIGVRTAMHVGALHVMKYTTLGEDIDLLHYLAPLGFGKEVLMTQAAVQRLRDNGQEPAGIKEVQAQDLRVCTSRERWEKNYSDQVIYTLPIESLLQSPV